MNQFSKPCRSCQDPDPAQPAGLAANNRIATGSEPLLANVFICLGSNFPEAEKLLDQALSRISLLPGCHLAAVSSVYLTEPQGFTEQPWFHNQVLGCALERGIMPADFLKQLLKIETELGRRRSSLRYGPRSIDIDLLLFDELTSADPFCTLPHPRMLERAFVLVPLREIAPGLAIREMTIEQWLGRLTWRQEGEKIFQST